MLVHLGKTLGDTLGLYMSCVRGKGSALFNEKRRPQVVMCIALGQRVPRTRYKANGQWNVVHTI